MSGEPIGAAPAWWDLRTWEALLREHSFEVPLVTHVYGMGGARVEPWVNALPSFAPTKQDGIRFVIIRRTLRRAGVDEEFEAALGAACALGGHTAVHALLLGLHREGRLR